MEAEIDSRYDVVLYGASGFVGRQTVQYFAQHVPRGQLRWAIAGRDRSKLAVVRDAVGRPDLDILVADSADRSAIDDMVGRSRILLSTAGPFALYGSHVVDACLRLKTHYVDITGETPWVRDLIDRHHDQAARDGTRIIPCCGFDSVPSDLGALLVVRAIQRSGLGPCAEVKAYFQMYGGVNGGTLASAFHLYDSAQMKRAELPFLLNSGVPPTGELAARSQDPQWVRYDHDVEAWIGPYFMAPINTRVVRRTASLFADWNLSYGEHFTYQEFLKYSGSLAPIAAAAVTTLSALTQVGLQFAGTRRLMKRLLPAPGTGPSETIANRGWFRCELIGRTIDGRTVRGLIHDVGDPSNRVTVKLLCESALTLALHPERLPGGPERGGVLTPATGLGDALIERLRHTGMTLS